jgi:hypothetical protein
VTGATVTKIAYTPDTDASKLASVVFTTTTSLSAGTVASMNITNGGAAVTGSASTCVVKTAVAGETPIECGLTASVAFANFDTVGLTVVTQ